MSFWDFLNWLWGAIDKVRAFFSSRFWDLYNGAANALNWAISEATQAYNNAKAWVLAQAYALGTDLSNFFNALAARITAAVNLIWTEATIVFNDAKAWATPLIQDAKDFASGLFSAAKTWVIGELQFLNSLLTSTINQAKADLHAIFDPLLTLSPYLNILTDLGSTNTYTRLKALVTSMFSMLSTMVENPLGFLTGLLFPIFAEVFCYAIGYGLGATQNQLPPIPVWGHGGSGVIPPPPILPPGTGQLTHPVDPIWVSGYSFTPPTHYGVDLGINGGQPVYAMHNGIVLESGWSNVGYGNTVLIQNDTWTSRYGHFQTCLVQAGQEVAAGQLIGYGDTTGNSTGNHLHLELKLNGTFVDPLLYL